ncbi:MAG: AI-2E family transporter [Acidimicrobiia bacterium]|nr:AI-2E family transporter [Acidimicrobiia bacterium]NCW49348.1 AI-2E family transporter [Actinomycetota bacterium]
MLSRALTTLGVVPDESPERPESPPVRWPPRWIVAVVVVFWIGWLGSGVAVDVWHRISGLVLLLVISLFLALAIEPGVNRLAQRGWRRGRATATIIFGVILAVGVFIGAMGTLIGTQIADLLANSETYISDTVDTINDWFGTEIDPEQVIADFNDPNGSVQQFIDSQQDDAIRLSGQVLNGLLAAFSVLLFSYYLVADGPRLRRSICSRLSPDRQERVLAAWELAINKTGGYLYSRLLLSLMSAFFHWAVFAAAGVRSPVALALWVGLVSQFLPVIGTYIAGILPVLITFLDSPVRALIVLGVIVVYQQLENYLISPKVTARTMELHPAVAFGSALAGLALLGPAGAVLALPTAAMAQALISEWGARHDVIDSPLTAVSEPRPVVGRIRRRGSGPE